MSYFLTEHESRSALAGCGIPLVEARLAATGDEAAVAASRLGFPVALKVMSRAIVHKSDAGCVSLQNETPDEVARSFERIVAAASELVPLKEIQGVLVEPMRSGAIELHVGFLRSDLFGPICTFGLGGKWVELIHDQSIALAPLEPVEVHGMLRELRIWPLFEGYRGSRAVDIRALCEMLASFSRFVCHAEHMLEVEMNPVSLGPEVPGGAVAIDARVKVMG